MSLKQTHWEFASQDRDFTQFYDWSRLIVQQIRRISCESEWTVNSLIFDLVEWFQSFVYTRWSAHEWRKMSAAAWTQVARSKSIENWRMLQVCRDWIEFSSQQVLEILAHVESLVSTLYSSAFNTQANLLRSLCFALL